jgi:hypothetical protein
MYICGLKWQCCFIYIERLNGNVGAEFGPPLNVKLYWLSPKVLERRKRSMPFSKMC